MERAGGRAIAQRVWEAGGPPTPVHQGSVAPFPVEIILLLLSSSYYYYVDPPGSKDVLVSPPGLWEGSFNDPDDAGRRRAACWSGPWRTAITESSRPAGRLRPWDIPRKQRALLDLDLDLDSGLRLRLILDLDSRLRL